ncbi:HAD family hydrolase [Pseudomonas syringae]|uniref:HAD family hydrolase n=2 Tax=Pseudomonas TaxID=286 RepID=UPI00128EFBA5|nr:HAD family hydrolase [Pseudomonas syringae]
MSGPWPMHYCTLLIDFDGTLFDTRNAIRKTLEALAGRRGAAPFAAHLIDQVIDQGLSLVDMLGVLLGPGDVPGLPAWVADYRAIYNGGLGVAQSAPYPGVEAVVQQLHEAGIELFIVSNKGEVSILDTLEQYRLGPCFRGVVAAVGDRAPKPDPASFFERVRPRMRHGDKAQVLVIGDTEIDLGYARNLGVASCWAAYGYGLSSRCEVLAPDFVIQSANDLLRLEDCRTDS